MKAATGSKKQIFIMNDRTPRKGFANGNNIHIPL